MLARHAPLPLVLFLKKHVQHGDPRMIMLDMSKPFPSECLTYFV